MKKLFGYSDPANDYFNDNLDQYYEEDDYFDYKDHPEDKFGLEDKEFIYSHTPAHKIRSGSINALKSAALDKALSPRDHP